MKRLVSFILMAASAALLASCLPDPEEFLYTESGMFTVAGSNQLITDSGNIYDIVQNNSGADIPDTLKRVMAVCDVLTKTAGTSNRYSVRLMEFAGAFVKDPVPMSGMDESAIGHDGLNIKQAWVTGGYLNAYSFIAMFNPSKVNHELNLVYDDVRSNADTLYFEVRHNAHGECPENEDTVLKDFVFAGAYLSFPLDGILEEGKKPIVHLEWDWYVGDEYSFTREKKTHFGNLEVF